MNSVDFTGLSIEDAEKIRELLREYDELNCGLVDGITPEGVVRRKAQIENQIRITVEYSTESGPVLAELASAGVLIDNIDQIRSGGFEDVRAGPILASWFPRVVFLPLKMDIASGLGRKWAQPNGLFALKAELLLIKPENDPGLDNLRGRIADAIERCISENRVDKDFVQDLVSFATNRDQGLSRGFVVMALGKLGGYRAYLIPVLIKLVAEDDEMFLAAVIALGKLHAFDAIQTVNESLLRHKLDSSAKKRISAALRQMSHGH